MIRLSREILQTHHWPETLFWWAVPSAAPWAGFSTRPNARSIAKLPDFLAVPSRITEGGLCIFSAACWPLLAYRRSTSRPLKLCPWLLEYIIIMIGKRLLGTNILKIILQRWSPCCKFSTDNKYANKSTKEIEREIALQKWKQLQNTFKSLNTTFGLSPPDESAIKNKEFEKPKKTDFTLEQLRECSHQYPVYLYLELQDSSSPFHSVISQVLENLWKAEQK